MASKLLLVIVFLLFGCADSGHRRIDKQLTQTTDQSNKAIAINFVESLNEAQNVDYSSIISKDFIQHNPSIEDGPAAYLKVMQGAAAKGQKIEIIRALEDADYVFLQSKYTFKEEKIVYDVF